MEEELCNTRLSLSIGRGGGEEAFLPSPKNTHGHENQHPLPFHVLFPARVEHEKEEEPTQVREKSFGDDDDVVIKDINEGGARKKLRLSKEQSVLLEGSFREHSILNAAQKQELANRLQLQVRQVEVWFQNRRARTKSKKTEVECEFLKRYCQTLSDENRRLKRELEELRLARPASSFYVRLPKQTKHSLCPACAPSKADGDGKSTSSLESMSEKSRIYSC